MSFDIYEFSFFKVSILALDNLDDISHDNLMNMVNGMTRKRHEILYYSEMSIFIKQRKYMKKVIRIEDFIDDMYSQNARIGQVDKDTKEMHKSYKLIIQTQPNFSNLIEDFFQFKYFLVCYIISMWSFFIKFYENHKNNIHCYHFIKQGRMHLHKS